MNPHPTSKIFSLGRIASILTLSAAFALGQSTLLSNFDGLGIPYQVGATEGPGPVGITAGGPSGSYFTLLNGTNSTRNFLAWNSVDDYTGWTRITLQMDLLADAAQADGIGINFMSTTTHGDTGFINLNNGLGGGGEAERALLPDSLGFGFRTYGGANATVTWNNQTVGGDAPYALNSGAWGSLKITVERNSITKDATVNVTKYDQAGLNGTASNVFTNLVIPNVTMKDFRVQIAGRTGGLAMVLNLDNVLMDVTIPDFQDADGDGLSDEWESFFGLDGNDNGLNPNNNGVPGDPSQGAAGDPDSDSLTNLQEFALETSPIDDDTDDDGLKDNVETLTGIYNSPSDTGTNPIIADTDEDGLLDGIENPTLSFIDANQPGTDPNNPDTDNDGVDDLAEILLNRNPIAADVIIPSPNLIADFDGNGENYKIGNVRSAPAGNLLPGGPTGNYYKLLNNIGDAGNYISFESAADYTGWKTVSFQMDFLAANVVADGLGINFLSTDAHGSSGIVRMNNDDAEEQARITNSFGVGLRTYNGFLSTLTWNGTTVSGDTPYTLPTNAWGSMEISLQRDPNTQDTLVNVTLYDQAGLAGSAFPVHTDFVIPAFNIEDFRVQIAGRTGGSAMDLSIDNLQLFIDDANSSGLEVTSISKQIVPGVAGAPDTLSVTVTWDSSQTTSYDILTSPDMAGGNLDLWQVLATGNTGTPGAQSTSFTETGIPLNTTKRFYVVRETP